MKRRSQLATAWVAWGALSLVVGCSPALRDVAPDPQTAALIRAELKSAAGGGDTAPVESQSVAEPMGWGTLRGSFKLGGDSPARKALTINKDTSICSANGPLYVEDLVVSPDGGIRNVLIFVSQALKNDEPWTHPSAKPGKSDEVVFDQKGCLFTTHLLAVQATQPIRLTNSDPVGHNANLAAKANAPFDQTNDSNASALYQPTDEERQPFPVSCAIHPWMKAWVMTRKNSYFAVSQADGSFEIPNLPAGVDLEFRVWHEVLGFSKQARLNGQDKKWSGGKFTQQVDPGGVTEFQVVFDVSAFK